MESAFFLVCIVIAAAVLLVGWYFQHMRRQMWQGIAQRYGLTFWRHDPYGIPKKFSHFALFRQGHSCLAYNCLEGAYQGRGVLLFDYRYKTGSGKNQSTHHLSAVLVDVDIPCPYLLIRPESFLDKIGDFLGFDDIDFEYEQFNRRFHVKGDKRFAYDICHSRTIDFLLANERLTWELSGDKLLLYGLGTYDDQEVAYCLEAATAFLGLIPPYLRKG